MAIFLEWAFPMKMVFLPLFLVCLPEGIPWNIIKTPFESHGNPMNLPFLPSISAHGCPWQPVCSPSLRAQFRLLAVVGKLFFCWLNIVENKIYSIHPIYFCIVSSSVNPQKTTWLETNISQLCPCVWLFPQSLNDMTWGFSGSGRDTWDCILSACLWMTDLDQLRGA